MSEAYVSIIGREDVAYPGKEGMFRPHCVHPEYLFPDCISIKKNEVYEMVRDTFKSLKLDIENCDTAQWNPLGKIIKPGDKVLVKPNLVLDVNHNPKGSMESVCTHPSVVAAVIDYVIIALKGKGEIVVGDAPVQECKFDKLIKENGYEDLIEWYINHNINIKLVDLRSSSNRSNSEGGVQYPQCGDISENGVLVSLNEDSAFCEMAEDVQRRMRVMNFDPRILQQHHFGKKHSYMISKEVLQADVIINIPKPKTHKIAGITGAQKNLFGSCANKDYLPHYTLGGKDENGDAYLHKNYWLSVADDIMDIKNIFNRECLLENARKAAEFYAILHREGHLARNNELYENGCWYGNDTIWRTIADINRIVLYADKKGSMKDTTQRKMFIVGDMIVSGEKDGPVAPSDYIAGLIIAGDDALAFDRVICAIMGFDERSIPQLCTENMRPSHMIYKQGLNPIVVSNNSMWDGENLYNIKKHSLRFSPASSWEYVLGNPLMDDAISAISSNDEVIIFGAGMNGIRVYEYIKKWHSDIKITAFWDNDARKQGRYIVDGVECIAPSNGSRTGFCIISAWPNFIASMYVEAVARGFTDDNIIMLSSGFVGNGRAYKECISHN